MKFPDEPKISDEAKDLICHLLCDVETRLGTGGVEEIKVITLKQNSHFSFFLWNCDEDESVRSMHQKD